MGDEIEEFRVGDTIEHQGGAVYTILHEAVIERDKIPAFVYQSLGTGTVWVRPTVEFYQVVNGRQRFRLASRLW